MKRINRSALRQGCSFPRKWVGEHKSPSSRESDGEELSWQNHPGAAIYTEPKRLQRGREKK